MSTSSDDKGRKSPVFVLVHGAWHSSEVWERVRSHLTDAGYKSVAVDLPSVGADGPVESNAKDVQVVRAAVINVLDHDQADCVVGTHSYGGVPGSEAVKGLSKKDRVAAAHGSKDATGVIGMGYITSYALDVEQSPITWETSFEAKARPDGLRVPLKFDMQGDKLIVLNGKEEYYNDMTEEDAEYWNSRLRSQAPNAFNTPVTYNAVKDIHSEFLLCTKDVCVIPPKQEELIKDIGITEVTKCDAGHSPFLSQPKATADFLQKIAEKQS